MGLRNRERAGGGPRRSVSRRPPVGREAAAGRAAVVARVVRERYGVVPAPAPRPLRSSSNETAFLGAVIVTSVPQSVKSICDVIAMVLVLPPAVDLPSIVIFIREGR